MFLATTLLYLVTWAMVIAVAAMIGVSFGALIRCEIIDFFGGIMVSILLVGVGWMAADLTNGLASYKQEWMETVEDNDDGDKDGKDG